MQKQTIVDANCTSIAFALFNATILSLKLAFATHNNTL